MNKAEIITALAEEAGLTKSDAATFLSAFYKVMQKALKDGEEIKLLGLGSFKIKAVSAKEARNPKTGEKIQIAAHKKIKFSPGQELRNAVNLL